MAYGYCIPVNYKNNFLGTINIEVEGANIFQNISTESILCLTIAHSQVKQK